MIKDFSFFLPTRILFGLNTWERIGEVAREEEEVRCLLADVGIPGKMSDLQVTDTHFKEMAADAAKSPPYLSNPRRCTVEELVGVLQKAL
jgi:hypothetical protein